MKEKLTGIGDNPCFINGFELPEVVLEKDGFF